MSKSVDLYQPLRDKICKVRRYGKEAEQLTVRIPSEVRKDLRRLAKQDKIKEGAMHRALLEWAIEAYSASKSRKNDNDLELVEEVHKCVHELRGVKSQIRSFMSSGKCERCSVASEVSSLKPLLVEFIELEVVPTSYSDGELKNKIKGMGDIK